MAVEPIDVDGRRSFCSTHERVESVAPGSHSCAMGADIKLDKDIPWLARGRVLFQCRQLRLVIDQEQYPKRGAESCELRKNAGIHGEAIETLDGSANPGTDYDNRHGGHTSSRIPSATRGSEPLISGMVDATMERYFPLASIILVSSRDCLLISVGRRRADLSVREP